MQKGSINRHLETHDLDRPTPYACDHPGCEHAYPSRRELHQHTVTHDEAREKPYWCAEDGCIKGFYYERDLSEHHLRLHTDFEKRHKCDSCGAAFKIRNHLKNHIRRLHSNRPPVICTICSKPYRDNTKLRDHMTQVHSEERPHKCTWEDCESAFKLAGTLRRHIRNVHQGKKQKVYPKRSKASVQASIPAAAINASDSESAECTESEADSTFSVGRATCTAPLVSKTLVDDTVASPPSDDDEIAVSLPKKKRRKLAAYGSTTSADRTISAPLFGSKQLVNDIADSPPSDDDEMVVTSPKKRRKFVIVSDDEDEDSTISAVQSTSKKLADDTTAPLPLENKENMPPTTISAPPMLKSTTYDCHQCLKIRRYKREIDLEKHLRDKHDGLTLGGYYERRRAFLGRESQHS